MGKRVLVKEKLVDNLELSKVQSNYIVAKKASGLSEDTIRNINCAFYVFSTYYDIEYVEEITEDLINDWIGRMTDKGLKPSSINSYLRYMRTFINWCIDKGYIKPFKVQLVKHQEEYIKVYTDEELKKLLATPNKRDFMEYRTWLITAFMLATGARPATISCIKKDDVDLVNGYVTYRHLKNKKAVNIPIPKSLCKMLIEFHEVWDTGSDWLFCSVSSGQLTSGAMRQAFNNYCRDRNVPMFSIYSLRHSFAKFWIKNGGGAFQLQQMLCHSDLTMTRRYVQLFSDDLSDDVMNFNPLDSLRRSGSRTKNVVLK